MVRAALCLSAAVLVSACATPVPPPGGPRDETPPRIVESTPAAGAVNVADQTVRITFSEYVDQTSFARAIAVTPAFDRPMDFSWRGRSVTIEFPEPLRENTTYLLTLDNNLRDVHGVGLAAPVTIAFSTGPSISRGILAGRVVEPGTGGAVAGADVFAYALPDSAAPDSLPMRPDYRTQTGNDGGFRFEYLTEQFYFVAALRDGNRNARGDLAEPFAPPPAPAFMADTVAHEPAVPWVLAALDTVPPDPLRVQSLSQTRHVLRVSEEVRFSDRDPLSWSLVDSASGASREIRNLYISVADARQVFFQTPPLDGGTHSLVAAALVDTSGNRLREKTLHYLPSSATDTVGTRFLGFLPTGGASVTLAHGVEPGVRFNQPVGSDLMANAVSVRDSTGASLVYNAITRNGTDYELHPEPSLAPEMRIEIDVDGSLLANPDSVYSIAFERVSSEDVGEISGLVLGDAGSIVVELHPVEVELIVPMYEARADATGSFIFRNVPAGSYRIRVYSDANENGRWDVGLLVPYRASETLTWHNEPVRVRARWETALPDTLRLPPISELP